MIKKVIIIEIKNVIIKELLFSIFDLIHLSLGPIDINNRNGIKRHFFPMLTILRYAHRPNHHHRGYELYSFFDIDLDWLVADPPD